MEGNHTHELLIVIAFLVAAVVFVPVFKRFGLGSVLGYLAAGMLLGPYVLGVSNEPESILAVAELGVVFLLFLIGLELNPSRLWAMRRDIFGLGALQIVACAAIIALYPLLIAGRPLEVAVVAGLGLALSSTAMIMPMIEERNAMRLPYGQKSFAVLLMQDMAIVPILLVITLLSPAGEGEMGTQTILTSVGLALLAVVAVVLVGHYLLSPVFRILARNGGREIMTAAALLVVLAAATTMVSVGLSMEMGAFIAGVLLAESNYRRELEANIEPFRGILLGLFFVAVGMALEFDLIVANWSLILGGLVTLVLFKAVMIYALVRLFGGDHATGTKTGLILSQGGEFGFVIFTAAAASGVMTGQDASLLNATVILSMVTTPFLMRYVPPLLVRQRPQAEPDEDFEGAGGEVLIIGFGRFGQLVGQTLLAGGYTPTLLDSDPDRVAEARRFGTRVYYGDGRRLDVLRAAGADKASLIAVCTTPAPVTTAVVDLVCDEFPHAKVFARAYDRRHALGLFDHKVTYQRRETFDSALRFARDALEALGIEANEAKEAEILVRRRDRERLEYQRIEGLVEGHRKWAEVTPEPYTSPDRADENDRREAAE